MNIEKIYIGGWFQRTTLHLSEIWDFFGEGTSFLALDKEEMARVRAELGISQVSRESGPLEYVYVKSTHGVDYRIYEDGLVVLEKAPSELARDFEDIKNYYDTKLSLALSLIFSKGAPVPKELANIKTILPYIVSVSSASSADIDKLFVDFREEVYSRVKTKNVEVCRGGGIIVINNLVNEDLLRDIIESQIFFREFKTQLHRYLAIHRNLWEKIRAIKERGEIAGTEIDKLRSELSLYQKTINLIGARIDQMPAYVRTRQKITNIESLDKDLQPLFQLKFETLLDTHEYVKHLWAMTKNYLGSTMELFADLQAKSTKNTISSLQLVTTIGVVAGILGYLSKDTLPTLTGAGMVYFLILITLTWFINTLVSRFYKRKRYPVDGRDVDSRI
jgi:hypothetical protein